MYIAILLVFSCSLLPKVSGWWLVCAIGEFWWSYGGNYLLSLCLMSLCKNQKQREKKVRINKFLEDSKYVLEPAMQGDWYPSNCTELVSSGTEACKMLRDTGMSEWITEVPCRVTERQSKTLSLNPTVLWQLCMSRWAVHWKGRQKKAALRVVVFSLSSVVTSHCKVWLLC